MREFQERTDGESAVDFGLSAVISGQQDDPIGELPELIASGVPTAKAFMVYDFRLPDERLFAALRAMGRHGGMLQVHCENATVIDALVADAVARGNVACRHHALTRPPMPRRRRRTAPSRWRGRRTHRSTSSTCRAPMRSRRWLPPRRAAGRSTPRPARTT